MWICIAPRTCPKGFRLWCIMWMERVTLSWSARSFYIDRTRREIALHLLRGRINFSEVYGVIQYNHRALPYEAFSEIVKVARTILKSPYIDRVLQCVHGRQRHLQGLMHCVESLEPHSHSPILACGFISKTYPWHRMWVRICMISLTLIGGHIRATHKFSPLHP